MHPNKHKKNPIWDILTGKQLFVMTEHRTFNVEMTFFNQESECYVSKEDFHASKEVKSGYFSKQKNSNIK